MNIGLYVWTFLALLHFAPPERQASNPWADPSAEYAHARYGQIASDIVSVCASKSCAELLVAIAVGEIGLARDADEGPCHRAGPWKTRCDSGKAASVWQVQSYGRAPDGEKVTPAKLFADRRLAASMVLRVASGSLKQCAHLPTEDRLANLGGGGCRPSKSARSRYLLWRSVSGWTP